MNTAAGISMLMIASQRRVAELERAHRAAMWPLEAYVYWRFHLYLASLDVQFRPRLTYTPSAKPA